MESSKSDLSTISFFVMLFVLLFVFIGFIFVVFDLSGFSFIFELGLLLSFMFLLAFGMFFVFHEKRASWGIVGALLIVLLFNVSVIFLLTNNFNLAHITTVLFTVVGLIVVLLNLLADRPKPAESVEVKQYDKSKYYYPFVDRVEIAEQVPETVHVEKTFTPGKFIASRKAAKFHLPRCDWAGRISKENQVWFNTKEEAQSKGFQADTCVV
ncbi:hypothetical protein CMO83_00055 [Candidatus Woesearchaeota archaeon]|jgi:hypothetical protein|nr:hypothetical protein [Candidatus Woesearchaeota archaeon]|tara:strand:- start:48690 stop:49322 length:633 start_codon:yes stop_codon:yes gene_type:complete